MCKLHIQYITHAQEARTWVHKGVTHTFSTVQTGDSYALVNHARGRLLVQCQGLSQYFIIIINIIIIVRTGCFCIPVSFINVMPCVVFEGGPGTLSTTD